MHHTNHPARRGFTMIELAIVIVVMALMAGVALPAFSNSLQKSRTTRAGSVIAADLELAFTLAARQRKPVRISFDASTKTYTIADRATGTVLRTRSFAVGTEFPLTSMTFSTTPMDVFPNGFASGSLTITISGGSTSHTVNMTRAGLVRVT